MAMHPSVGAQANKGSQDNNENILMELIDTPYYQLHGQIHMELLQHQHLQHEVGYYF